MKIDQPFVTKQIVWAKVKGYPWWPAEVVKVPSADHNVFKVIFTAEQTHAFLHPRDVRKYAEFYEECSKKKTRGLGGAIQAADQIYKKRADFISKSVALKSEKTKKISKVIRNNGRKLGKHTKNKKVKKIEKPEQPNQSASQEAEVQGDQHEIEQENKVVKLTRSRVKKDTLDMGRQESEEQLQISGIKPLKKTRMIKKILVQEGEHQAEKPSVANSSQQSGEIEIEANAEQQNQKQVSENLERIQVDSEQKLIDRSKIQKIEEELLVLIEQLKQGKYKPRLQYFKELNSQQVSGEELAQSKITNMLSFISSKIASSHDQTALIRSIKARMREQILEYLTDTGYYDQYIKVVSKNKRIRTQFENKLIGYMRVNYKIKKELASLFASKLGNEVTEGAINREKQLLEDFRDKKIELVSVNSKTAVERNMEAIVTKYQ